MDILSVDRFPFIEEKYTEGGAAKIANWAIQQGIEDLPDRCFRSFEWEVIESEDHETLVEVQRFFGFMHSGWIKVEKPSLRKMVVA